MSKGMFRKGFEQKCKIGRVFIRVVRIGHEKVAIRNRVEPKEVKAKEVKKEEVKK